VAIAAFVRIGATDFIIPIGAAILALLPRGVAVGGSHLDSSYRGGPSDEVADNLG